MRPVRRAAFVLAACFVASAAAASFDQAAEATPDQAAEGAVTVTLLRWPYT